MSRILVVDDEPLIRAFLAEELAETGYHVATATNGAEALARVHAEPTDLVLLDLLMPCMDGLEFLSERAAHPRLAKIPVVVLSAAGIDGLRTAHQLRATAVLGKPLDLDVLAQVIDHVLEQWRPVSPASAAPLYTVHAARGAHVRTHFDADQDGRGVHRIADVLDSPALHRLWQDSLRCCLTGCRP